MWQINILESQSTNASHSIPVCTGKGQLVFSNVKKQLLVLHLSTFVVLRRVFSTERSVVSFSHPVSPTHLNCFMCYIHISVKWNCPWLPPCTPPVSMVHLPEPSHTSQTHSHLEFLTLSESENLTDPWKLLMLRLHMKSKLSTKTLYTTHKKCCGQ